MFQVTSIVRFNVSAILPSTQAAVMDTIHGFMDEQVEVLHMDKSAFMGYTTVNVAVGNHYDADLPSLAAWAALEASEVAATTVQEVKNI